MLMYILLKLRNNDDSRFCHVNAFLGAQQQNFISVSSVEFAWYKLKTDFYQYYY